MLLQFFLNLMFMTLGALLAAVGIYASLDKWRSGDGFKLENVVDVLLNISLLLIIIGGIVFLVRFPLQLFPPIYGIIVELIGDTLSSGLMYVGQNYAHYYSRL